MASESTADDTDQSLPLIDSHTPVERQAATDDELLTDREVIALFAGRRKPSRLRLAWRRLRGDAARER